MHRIKLTIIYFVITIILFINVSEVVSETRNISDWEKLYLKAWDRYKQKAFDWSLQPYSAHYYHLAKYIDGLTAMYEATNNSNYLEQSIELITNVINQAKEVKKIGSDYSDNFFGWISNQDSKTEIPLYESYFFRYVTKLLRIIRDKNIINKYPKFYNNTINFVEKNIWEKWYTRGLENIYRSRTHMASHWAYIALDLYLITDDVNKLMEYYNVFNNINHKGFQYGSMKTKSSLKNNLKNNTSNYSWIYSDWAHKIIQDVSHANSVVSYIIESHCQNIHWNRDDINGLIEMLDVNKRITWYRDEKDNKIKVYAHFNGATKNTELDMTNPNKFDVGRFQTDGWIKLGRFDKNIYNFYEENIDYIINYLSYFSFNAYAHMALNKKLLESGIIYNRPFFYDNNWLTKYYGFAPNGWYIGDFNGDGKDDIFRYICSKLGADMFISNGKSFVYDKSWLKAYYGSAPNGWYVGDFNGDGKDDIFRYIKGKSGADMFISNGKSFVYDKSWLKADYGSAPNGWYVGDFNGDGKDDIFRYIKGKSGADMFISNGKSFVYDKNWLKADYGSAPNGWYVGDFNGDGKDDIFRYLPGKSGADMFISNGKSFVYDKSWLKTDYGSAPNGWYISDFNGDGKDDIFKYIKGESGAEVFLSENTKFVPILRYIY